MSNVAAIRPVQLSTFAVTLQALTINNKQMTISVFRQLPVKKPFDFVLDYGKDGGALFYDNVIYWGYVNYQGSWLIWQRENLLYRFSFFKRHKYGDYNYIIDIHWDDFDSLKELNLPQLFIAV
jgi:hypothetical protein